MSRKREHCHVGSRKPVARLELIFVWPLVLKLVSEKETFHTLRDVVMDEELNHKKRFELAGEMMFALVWGEI